MLEPAPGFPDLGIWGEEELASFDLAACTARIHPDASGPELDLVSAWMTWGTYIDDYFPLLFNNTRDMAGAKVFSARLSAFMPLDMGATSAPANPAETGLTDLWIRTATPLSFDQRRQLRHNVEALLESWLWELDNHIQQRIPDPVDYVGMCRTTSGAKLVINLIGITRAGTLPAKFFATRTMRGLENSAIDHVCFTNDIFSYQKEIEFEGELHNCVLVVQKFLDIDREPAVLVVNDLMTARLQQFEYIIATELPALADDFDLDDDARKALDGYVEELRTWVVGMFHWHPLSCRFDEAALLKRYRTPPQPVGVPAGLQVGVPTGLGTATTRIATLLGAGDRG